MLQQELRAEDKYKKEEPVRQKQVEKINNEKKQKKDESFKSIA